MTISKLISTYQIDRVGLLKIDIEGGEFAVFADEDLPWLRVVDQIALEIHPGFGDVADLVGKIRGHGFEVDLRNNNGRQVDAVGTQVEYAYCTTPERH